MDLKNKKGFITIYVMLAMMFFVVFVVTASVTASRKIKLQTEANTALYDIYSEDIDNIVQDTKVIPIYTKAQFLQIAKWIDEGCDETEYMYINDTVYKLAQGGEDYQFVLKTDLWFKEVQTASKDDNYPYKMESWIHNLLKRENNLVENEKLKIGLYNYDMEYSIYIKTDKDGNQKYGIQKIEISTAEQFLKIGTGEKIDGEIYGATNSYELKNNIEITDEDLDGIDFSNRPEFKGILNGNDQIVEGLKITVTSESENVGFFKSNSGRIENLTLTDVSAKIKGCTNFGILAGINNETGEILDCNIMLSNKQTNGEMIIEGNGNNSTTITNFGVLVGSNKGAIGSKKSEINLQGLTIQNVNSTYITYLGVVAGYNEGTIENTNLLKCKIIEGNANSKGIGLIAGQNSKTINGIEIDDCDLKNIYVSDDKGNIGGIAGKNEGTINDITINNKLDISVKKGQYIGGVAGNTENQISEVKINGNLNLTIYDTNTNNDSWVGGIVGMNNSSTISKIKVTEEDTKACINIIIEKDGYAKFVGGIAAENNNGKIENCIINGTIDDAKNIFSTYWHATGGIVGRSIGKKEKTIENCYSNMLINYCKTSVNLGTGGIVGVTGWNDAVGINTIKNCAYVNEIVTTSGIAGNGIDCGVGGIVGENWLGDNENNEEINQLIIRNCVMNGKIPTDSRAGAMIGIVSNHNVSAKIDARAEYNKAYRWLGYVSTIPSGVTLIYDCTANDTSELDKSASDIKNTINSAINSAT